MNGEEIMDREERRVRVEQLLRYGTSEKALHQGTENATRYLRDAYELASIEPELPSPLPELAAYRLANILMRSAPDTEALLDAEELMAKAVRSKALGPLPALYHLPILHRIYQGDENPRAKERLRRAFKTADERIRESDFAIPHTDTGAESRAAAAKDESVQMQYHLFNLLELSAFFLNEEYRPLSGMGGPYLDLYPDYRTEGDVEFERWVLVGHDRRLAAVKYPRTFAMAELESRLDQNPNTITFRIPPNENERAWRFGKSEWKPAGRKQLLFLASGLHPGIRTKEQFRERAMDGAHSVEAFRRAKHALSKRLSDLTGYPKNEIFVEDADTGITRLSPNIPVFGALHERSLIG